MYPKQNIVVRDGPLENLWGGGGGAGGGRAKYKKNIRARENARQLILKKIHAMAEKKFIQGI